MLAFLLLMTLILFTSSFNWTSQIYANPTSGSISFYDENNHLYWQCGGISQAGTLISTCKAFDFSTEIAYIAADNINIGQESFFPGFTRPIPSYFSTTQNVGIKVNDRVCMQGLRDGTLSSKCYCCDFNFYTCDEVPCQPYYTPKPTCFEECIIPNNDVLIKIGGGYGNKRRNEISTFDVATEDFIHNSYGDLQLGVQNAGCTMLNDGTIIVVGGDTPTNSYAREIQICKPGYECSIFPLSLVDGIKNTRCMASLNENEVICFGGNIHGYGISPWIYIIDIEDQTIYYDSMPTELVGLSIYTDDSKTCLVGGTTLDSDGYSVVSDEIFCTEDIISSGAKDGHGVFSS